MINNLWVFTHLRCCFNYGLIYLFMYCFQLKLLVIQHLLYKTHTCWRFKHSIKRSIYWYNGIIFFFAIFYQANIVSALVWLWLIKYFHTQKLPQTLRQKTELYYYVESAYIIAFVLALANMLVRCQKVRTLLCRSSSFIILDLQKFFCCRECCERWTNWYRST